MAKQFYRFYLGARSAAYQLGISEFTCIVRKSGSVYEWTVSAPIGQIQSEIILIDRGSALTPDSADKAVDAAIRHLTNDQLYLPYIWSI